MDILLADQISIEARNRVAQNLARVGLPDPALYILDAGLSSGDPQANLMAANVHFTLDRIDETLDVLDDNSDDDAELLRANALTRLGKHQEALQVVASANMANDHPEFAWRAGSWATATASTDPAIHAMATFMHDRDRGQGDTYDPTDPPVDDYSAFRAAPPPMAEEPLAAANGLQAQSSAIRRMISAALESGETASAE